VGQLNIAYSTKKHLGEIWISPTLQVFDGEPFDLPNGDWLKVLVTAMRDRDLSAAGRLYFEFRPYDGIVPGWFTERHSWQLTEWANQNSEELAKVYHGDEYNKIYCIPIAGQ
jgi:hypothetical protein